MILLSALLLTSCGRQDLNGKKTVTEGADTVCEITGYNDFSQNPGSIFLKEGDAVAVISPSSLPTREQADAVMKGLKAWGYVPVEGKHVCDNIRTQEDCLEDLEWALNDPDIKAVFCVRGGYGASEVMDVMPEGLIASSEKLIIGYSDITVYHSAWTTEGIPSIHASMSAAFTDLPEACAEAEKRMLGGEIPSYRCEGSVYDREGAAEGVLIGGNLATLTAVLGTAYNCTETGEPYILFLEDVDEDLEHIHRFITILDRCGVLERASGIIFGEWADMPEECEVYSGDSRGGEFTSAADMITREFLSDISIPVAFGFPAGHGDVNYPLLMGQTLRMEVGEKEYTLEWLSDVS